MPSSKTFALHARRAALRARRLRQRVRPVGVFVVSVALVVGTMAFGGATAQAAPSVSLSQQFPTNTTTVGTEVPFEVDLTTTSGAQSGLGFKYTAPSGLLIDADSTSASTTCVNDAIAVAQDDKSFTWTGRVPAAGCAVTVHVSAAIPAQYTSNGNANFSALQGVNAPTGAKNLFVYAPDQGTWGVCPVDGFLFQNTNADVNAKTNVVPIDLGSPTTIADIATIGDYVNAVGYNQKDQYFWGWDVTTDDLVRIGQSTTNGGDLLLTHYGKLGMQESNSSAPPLGSIPRLAPVNNPQNQTYGFNLGDISPQGIMYLGSSYYNNVVAIDLSQPGNLPVIVPTLTRRSNTPTGLSDWAWVTSPNHPAQGALYGIGELGQTGSFHLFKTDVLNPSQGTALVIDLGALGGVGQNFSATDTFGAVFADASGALLFADNDTGTVYSIPNVNSLSTGSTPQVKTTGVQSSTLQSKGNDAARCSNAGINLDFGDAPDKQFTTLLASDGPRDEVLTDPTSGAPLLSIGATNTFESDGVPDAAAHTDTGDDAFGTFTTGTFVLTPGTEALVSVPVTNNTDQPARLAGWLDLTGKGPFDRAANGTAVASIGKNSGTNSFTLDLGFVPANFTGPAYLRLRLEQGTAAPTPTGLGTPGEVEDWRSTSTAPTISADKTIASVKNPSDQFQVSIRSSNGSLVSDPSNPSTTATPAQIGTGQAAVGPLPAAALATYTVAETAVAGTGTSLSDYDSTHICVDENDGSTVSPQATGTTFTVQIPAKATPADVLCSFTNTAKSSPTSAIQITKSSPTPFVTPNGTVNYQVTVSNAGNTEVDGVTVQDALPNGIAQFNAWHCYPSATATCVSGTPNSQASGTNAPMSGRVDLPAGQSVTYYILATAAEQVPSTVTNTAAATPPAGVLCAPLYTPGPCEAQVSLPSKPAISLLKNVVSRAHSNDQFDLSVFGGSMAIPDTAVTNGPASGLQTAFVGPDSADAGDPYQLTETGDGGTSIANYTTTYSCVDEANDPTRSFVSGSTSDGTASVTVPVGKTFAPDVQCTFTNTAIAPQISVTKSESTATIVPGGSITYTVAVANTGVVSADNTALADLVPAGIASFTWTCSGTNPTRANPAVACPTPSGTTTTSLSDTYPTFPAGQIFSYSIIAPVIDNVPPAVVNTATATPPPTGFCTSVDSTTGVSTTSSVAGVQCSSVVTATGDQPTVTAQKNVVSYFDSGDVFKVSLSGPLIPANSAASTTPGLTGNQATVGPFAAVAANTYTVTEDVVAGAGTMNNYSVGFDCVDTQDSTVHVSVSAVQNPSNTQRTASFTVPTGATQAAHVLCTFTNTAQFTQIDIKKEVNPSTQKLVPGGALNYSLKVTNTGSIDASGTTINDPLPAGIHAFTSWTCSATGGAVCPVDTTIVPGSGPITNQVISLFPSGSSVSYDITAEAESLSLPSSVTNTAKAQPPLHGTCFSGVPTPCPASATVSPTPSLTVSKTLEGRVNSSDQFTISLNGPGLPGTLTASTSAAGTGPDQAVIAQQPVDAGATYTVAETGIGGADLSQYTSTYSCRDSANATLDPNSGIVGSGRLDPANPQFQLRITQVTAQVPNIECVIDNKPNSPLLSIAKSSQSTLVAGGDVVYSVTVTNAGTVPADGSRFTDIHPIGISQFNSWSCTPTNAVGAVVPCPDASGLGDVRETFSSFPVGQTFTYSIDATATATPPTSVTNTAYVAPPLGGRCADGSAVPCQAQAILQIAGQPGISVRKFVASSLNSTDSFQLKISGGSINSNNTLDTTPGGSGYWSNLGPFDADATSSYTVSETGVGSTNLGDYSISYRCADAQHRGDPAFATGVTSSVTFTLPHADSNVVCFFTNTALPQTITVKKNIASYYSSSDAFTLRVAGSDVNTNNTATTNSYPSTGVVASTPAVPASAGTQYTISETGVSSTDLAHYAISYNCVNVSGADPSRSIAAGSGASAFIFQMPASVPPAQVECTFTNTARPTVSILKTADRPTIVPGGQINYQVTVTNTSPLGAANGTSFSDSLPAGLDHIVSVSCQGFIATVPTAGICPTISNPGPLAAGAGVSGTFSNFPNGASAVYSVAAVADADPSVSSVVNIATVTPPTGDPGCTNANLQIDPSYCSSTVTTPVVQPTVTVQKTIASRFVPGDNFTVHIEGAQITGSNTASTTNSTTQAQVTPALRAEATKTYDAYETAVGASNLANYTQRYACVDTANLTAGSPTVVNTSADLIHSRGVIFTVPTAQPNAANIVCTITNTAIPPSIGITKIVQETSATPGGFVHYVVTVTNTGDSDASGVLVEDPLPQIGIDQFTSWTCTPSQNALCSSQMGAGPITQRILKLQSRGDYVTFTITAKVSSNAGRPITNTAYATPPASGTCSTPGVDANGRCDASAIVSPLSPTIEVQKNVVGLYAAGDTFTVSVLGPNISVITAGKNSVTSNPSLPGPFTSNGYDPAWAGSTYAVSETAVAGSLSNYQISYSCTDRNNVARSTFLTGSGQPSFTFTMPVPTLTAPNSADVLCQFTNTARPSIALTKVTSNTTVQPNGTVSYLVTVTGTSVVPATNVLVKDAAPFGIQSFTAWDCSAVGTTATCGNGQSTETGLHDISETIASISLGDRVTYRITGQVFASPPPTVTNTATAAPSAPGFCSTTGAAICTASVTISPSPIISISKTTTTAIVGPNGSIEYQVVVTNSGVIGVPSVTVNDPLPTGLAGFTSVTCSGAACPTSIAVTPAGFTAAIGTFVPGASVMFIVDATVVAAPPARIENVATALPPPGTLCASTSAPVTFSSVLPCSAKVDTPSKPIVFVTKSADTPAVVPGDLIHYTITASNDGTADAIGSTLTDHMPLSLEDSTWECSVKTGVHGVACPSPNSGSGDIVQNMISMPAGTVLLYSVTARVRSTPLSPIVNNVSFDPHGGLCDDPPVYSATCGATVSTPVLPQVSITKVADREAFTPNGPVNFTVTVKNIGAVDATGYALDDPTPIGLTNVSWTCTLTDHITPCSTPAGTGALTDSIPTLAVGDVRYYDIAAQVVADPPIVVTNRATLTAPPNGRCVPDPGDGTGKCVASVDVKGPALAFTGVVLNGMIPVLLSSMIGGGLVLILLSRRRRKMTHPAR